MSSNFPGGGSTLLPPKPPPLGMAAQQYAVARESTGGGKGKTIATSMGPPGGEMLLDLTMSPNDIQVVESISMGSSSQETAADIEGNKNEMTIWPTAPFPPRPGQSLYGRITKTSGLAGSTINVNVNEARVQGDPPTVSKVYPNSQTADYCPWRGNHAEDSMNEQTIKTGFQNKPLITNESNTARPSVYHHLRNKGTQSLSALFVTLLEKRQASNRISSPSTFKLPPRLTMSTSRRETFLKELADPSRPLRKLNRSVPHAISGRVLLDQCLSRRIPVPRATWLAKCIGAHDIRAIKRKSAAAAGTGTATTSSTMSSEAKWIKEWTVQVQNFVKSAFTGAGELEWKANLDYVIRFSTNLYNEKLLDEEHYLDWILSSLEASSVDQLPIWMLLLHIYWKDLTTTRKRGKRMAEGLLLHIEQCTVNNFDGILNPVVDRAKNFILRLAVCQPGCLIIPKSWSRYRPIFQNLWDNISHQQMRLAISNLIKRNDRLIASSSGNEKQAPGIIKILDAWTCETDEVEVLQYCLKIAQDKQLVHLILKWASSVYRHGKYRVYAAARLLRKLRDMDHEIDSHIWIAVVDLASSGTCRESLLHQVVIELVRTKHFRIGRFLQHLISTGLPSPGMQAQDSALVRLLCNIPLNGESEQVRNLHEIMLESSSVRLSAEEEQWASVKQNVAKCISMLESNDEISVIDISHLLEKVKTLSTRQMFSFGFWLRKQIFSRLPESTDSITDVMWSSSSEARTVEKLFVLTRALLETVGEYPCLADTMMAFMDLDSQSLLASIAQTMHHGFKCYISFSAMKPLFDKLIGRYERLRAKTALDKGFCCALLSLGVTLDANRSILTQIHGDLLRCDQMATAAMCSPASDSAVISAPDSIPMIAGTDISISDAEIEKSLSNGTHMDEALLERLLKKILRRMRDVWEAEASTDCLPAGSWLARLRTFSPTIFDIRFKSAMTFALCAGVDERRFVYEQLIPVAIEAGCLSIADFVKCFEEMPPVPKDITFDSNLRLIQSLLPGDDLDEVGYCELYKYRLDKKIYAQTNASSIFNHIKEILQNFRSGNNEEDLHQLEIFLQSPKFLEFLSISLSTEDLSNEITGLLLSSLNSNLKSMILNVIESLLDPNHSIELSTLSTSEQSQKIIDNVDELSMSFCCLWIKAQHLAETENDKADNGIAKFIIDAVIRNEENKETGVTCQLVSHLDTDIRCKIFESSKNFVLDFLESNSSPEPHKLVKHIDVLSSMSSDVSEDGDAYMEVLGKFKLVIQKLSDETSNVDETSINAFIYALLQLLVIYKSKASQMTQSRMSISSVDNAAFVSTLCLLMCQPRLSLYLDTLKFLFDVSALCTDDMMASTLNNIVAAGIPSSQSSINADMSEHQRGMTILRQEVQRFAGENVAVKFLLGSGRENEDAWLGLIIPIKSQSGQQGQTLQQQQGIGSQSQRPGSQVPPSPIQRIPGQVPRQQSSPAALVASITNGGAMNTTSLPALSKSFAPPVPFHVRNWDLLPDQGTAGSANDTAISLSLFATRKV